MSPYQGTLQMYCPFICSKYCAKSCFSKTLHETAVNVKSRENNSFSLMATHNKSGRALHKPSC
jgi:hypothetical protein